jgi:DNA-binding NarL/FixJ family response regulator
MDDVRDRPGAGTRGAGGPRVVVVEASAFFREAVCRALAQAGHRARGESDLAGATAALADPELGLIVLDLSSTGAAGIEAFRAVRGRRPAVRAIVLASAAGEPLVLEALRAGASDYLAKPLHEEELLLSVERALAGFTAERELARLREQAAEPAAAAGAEGDLDLARELCEAVTADHDPARVMGSLLRILAGRLSACGAALYLRDPEGLAFVREAAWDGAAAEDRERLPAERGLSGACAATGAFVAVADPRGDPRFDPAVDLPETFARELAAGAAPPALLFLPLRFRGRTVALARAFLVPGVAPSLRTAEIAGAALSAALRSVLLYRSWRSSIDELAHVRREELERGRPAGARGVPGQATR